METARSKKRSTEALRGEVECQMSSQPSTSSAKTKAMGEKQKKSQIKIMVVNQRRKKNAQDTETPGHTCRKKLDTSKQLLLQGLSQIKCPN